MTRKGMIWSLLLLAGMVAVATYHFSERRHSTSLPEKLAQIVPVAPHTTFPCLVASWPQPAHLSFSLSGNRMRETTAGNRPARQKR